MVPSLKLVRSVTRLPRLQSKKRRRTSLVLHKLFTLKIDFYFYFYFLGRAKKRLLYNRRFKTAVVGFGKKGVRISILFYFSVFYSLFLLVDELSNEISSRFDGWYLVGECVMIYNIPLLTYSFTE